MAAPSPSSNPFQQPGPVIPPVPSAGAPIAHASPQGAAQSVMPGAGAKPQMTLPPSLWGSTPRETLRESFMQARWMLIAYWALLLNGYLALVAVIAGGGKVVQAAEFTGMVVVPSMIGVAAGHLIAMFRVRAWIVWVSTVALTIAVAIVLAVAGPVAIAAIVFLWSVACGHLAMQRKSSLSAIWIPIVCWAGAIITLLEREGRLHVWLNGDKSSIWQPLPLMLLFMAITEIFLFFAGQEHFHTTVWQAHTRNESALKRRGGGGARLTGKGIFVLVAFSGLICGAVALLSPYLWRTENRQGNGQNGGSGQQQQNGQQPQNDPNGQNGNGSGGGSGSGNQNGGGGTSQDQSGGGGQSGNGRDTEFDPDAVGRALDRAEREAERSASYLLPLIPLFLLTRPMRRAFLLRHLRKPLWKINPSRRARNLWRYILIALGDAGVRRVVSDSIDDEVRKIDAVRVQRGMPPATGLSDAAKQYQRMRFGLGIPAGALEQLRGHAETAFRDIRAPLDAWQIFKSWWRKIEV